MMWRTGELPNDESKIVIRKKGKKLTVANPKLRREEDLLKWEWFYLQDLIKENDYFRELLDSLSIEKKNGVKYLIGAIEGVRGGTIIPFQKYPLKPELLKGK